MVVSGSGDFVDEQGSSRGISSEFDRKLIGRLRSLSDVVVTGGNTARVEQYQQPKHADLAVITRSPGLFSAFQTLTPPNGVAVTDWCLSRLRELGYERILLEVGPTLAREFLTRNVVDEFCLTVTSGNLEVAQSAMQSLGSDLHLVKSGAIEGTLFTVWRRGNNLAIG